MSSCVWLRPECCLRISWCSATELARLGLDCHALHLGLVPPGFGSEYQRAVITSGCSSLYRIRWIVAKRPFIIAPYYHLPAQWRKRSVATIPRHPPLPLTPPPMHPLTINNPLFSLKKKFSLSLSFSQWRYYGKYRRSRLRVFAWWASF